MLNADKIFENIKSYEDIKALMGREESLFLDFKTTTSNDGKLNSDDKKVFRKALSGFSHQEGGVILWGIDCSKNPDTGIDKATSEKPVPNPQLFVKSLLDYLPYAIEPIIENFKTNVIWLNDDEVSNKGFILFFVPKSAKTHVLLDPVKTSLFFKRVGDRFWPVATSGEIKSLFLRSSAPILKINISDKSTFKNNNGYLCCHISIENIGHYLADKIGVTIKGLSGFEVFGENGNRNWNFWRMSKNKKGDMIFYSEVTLFPGQEIPILVTQKFGSANHKFSYEVYAKDMEKIEADFNLSAK